MASDEDLVARSKARDKHAFEHLLQPLIGPALRFAYGMLQDRAGAEDVVQEAALKAWRRLGNLRPGAEFRPWFLGIVANECRTLQRSRWWSVLRRAEVHGSAAVAPEGEFLRGVDLRRAVAQLPHDQRAVILLHFYLDLPLDEVARTAGISVAGVKSRINRALRKLRPSVSKSEAAT